MTLEINLTANKINDAVLSNQISEILKFKKAKILNLSSNFITENGVAIIIKQLNAHPGLEKVILRGNYISDRVFSILKAGAHGLKKLKYFDFSENREKINRTTVMMEVANLKKMNIFLEMN